MYGICPFASSRETNASESALQGEIDLNNESSDKCQQQSTHAICPAGFGSSSTRCPLGFGSRTRSSVDSFSTLPRISSAVLSGHRDAKVRLVSLKGVVFDVSADHEFSADGRLSQLPGHDASRFLALAKPGQVSVKDSEAIFDAGLEGLAFEDHKRLESYFVRMTELRPPVAVLADEDHIRIFGMPFGGREGFPRDVQATECPASLVEKLHSLLEQGDLQAVGAILQGETSSSKFVDAPCSRTGMTPLLKAVEGGSEDMVRVLLEAGADVRAKAMLYDGDDAVSLARRLGERHGIVEMLLAHGVTL